MEEAEELGRAIADDAIDLCVTTEFERTRQTADVALAGRDVPRLVVPELNDPLYGDYEGGALEDYRAWADGAASSDEAPGGGESRRHIVERYVRGFRLVLSRAEARALVVAHSLPIAYVLAALDGAAPARRVPLVRHAHPYRLAADELEGAVAAPGELVRLSNLVKLALAAWLLRWAARELAAYSGRHWQRPGPPPRASARRARRRLADVM